MKLVLENKGHGNPRTCVRRHTYAYANTHMRTHAPNLRMHTQVCVYILGFQKL